MAHKLWLTSLLGTIAHLKSGSHLQKMVTITLVTSFEPWGDIRIDQNQFYDHNFQVRPGKFSKRISQQKCVGVIKILTPNSD